MITTEDYSFGWSPDWKLVGIAGGLLLTLVPEEADSGASGAPASTRKPGRKGSRSD